MAITWANSADKHGIEHEDALHAIANAYYVEREFDEPRVPGRAADAVPRAAAPAGWTLAGGDGRDDPAARYSRVPRHASPAEAS